MENMGKIMALVALLCFGSFGGVVCYYGLSCIQENRAFMANTTSATGLVKSVGEKIVETGSGSTRSRGSVQYAEIEFRTAKGKTVTFEQQFGLIEGCPEKGDEVQVAYHEDEPTRAKLSSFSALWAGNLFVVLVGAGFIGVGVISFFLLRS